MNRLQQTGAALLSMVFLVILLTFMASQVLLNMQSEIRFTNWVIVNSQAFQYALGGEALAREILIDDVEDLKQKQLSRSPIPTALPHYHPQDGDISLQIVDLQGLVNLNNINATGPERNIVVSYMNSVLLHPELINLMLDWVDADLTPRNGGAEDSFYLNQTPPYRSANSPFSRASELLAFTSLTPSELTEQKELMTALPEATLININTMPTELATLVHPQLIGKRLNSSETNTLSAFGSIQDFLQAPITAGLGIDESIVTVQSSYFEARIKATFQDKSVWLKTRLHVDINSGKIKILDRTITTPFPIETKVSNSDKQNAENTLSIF